MASWVKYSHGTSAQPLPSHPAASPALLTARGGHGRHAALLILPECAFSSRPCSTCAVRLTPSATDFTPGMMCHILLALALGTCLLASGSAHWHSGAVHPTHSKAEMKMLMFLEHAASGLQGEPAVSHEPPPTRSVRSVRWQGPAGTGKLSRFPLQSQDVNQPVSSQHTQSAFPTGDPLPGCCPASRKVLRQAQHLGSLANRSSANFPYGHWF